MAFNCAPDSLPDSQGDAPVESGDLSHAPSETPLVTQLGVCARRDHAAFYAPGHKQGRAIAPTLTQLLGHSVFQADLPELPELDNLFNPEGVIQEAQELAAQTFGADQTWFLANGSTCGIEAAVLAVCRPGDKLIVPRNVHQSVVSALILSGAVPVFLAPEVDPEWDMAHGVSLETVEQALNQHPDARAVLLVYPTYFGVGCDLAAIAQRVHAQNLPLLVDEAHGPHFAFHPHLPPSALAAGADLTVQSTHKVLSALTQASMLHLQGDRVSPDRIRQTLQLVQSSSPSYLLLASLDAARQQMATAGAELMERTLAIATRARAELSSVPGVRVFELQTSTSAAAHLDLTRLTIDVTGLGLSGYEADEILHQQLGVTAELPTLKTLTFIISLGNTEADIERLISAVRQLAQGSKSSEVESGPDTSEEVQLPAVSLPALSPRDAFFAETESVAIAQAPGRISAELICPYPPGIPAVLPGEVITPETLRFLKQVLDQGGFIAGCADAALETLRVVRT